MRCRRLPRGHGPRGHGHRNRLRPEDAYISLLNRDSYNISRFYAHHYAMVLRRALTRRRYDVVHLESLYTTPYIDTHSTTRPPGALIALRSHSHEYQIWEQRWKSAATLCLDSLSDT